MNYAKIIKFIYQMKILTLWEPYASFIKYKLKNFETRSWGTSYRGEILIHAAKRKYKIGSFEDTVANKVCQLAQWDNFDRRTLDFVGCSHLPLGEIVAIAQLTDCIQMSEPFIEQQSEIEIACGNWQPLRFAWKFENIRPITQQILFRGKQGLVNAPPEVIEQVQFSLSQPVHKTLPRNSVR
jgi:hypothetical protein